MAKFIIHIEDKDAKAVEQFVQKLGGKVLPYTVPYTSETVISKVEEGLAEVYAIRSGKIKGLTLDEVIGE